MPYPHAGLVPGPEATRLAAAAARQLVELEAFLAEVERSRGLLPADRCVVWRSQASEAYEARVRELPERLAAVVSALGEACEHHRTDAARLRTIADAPVIG